jgi:predicted site-specific integrase-resolvase
MTETHPEKRLIGYARVSTYGQTLDSQRQQPRAAGCASRNIYREKVTGTRPDRRELNRMLGKLASGDVVTVTRIDRLARSTGGPPPSTTTSFWRPRPDVAFFATTGSQASKVALPNR